MNDESSRSHAICTINMSFIKERDKLTDGAGANGAVGPIQMTSKIHLVDLAGSERLRQMLHKGESTQETRQINKGLHALSKVIYALAASSSKSRSHNPPLHVPYRDSKLTRLLQDSLGGSAHTLMIACVSPSNDSMQETLSTLQYACRARRIENVVVPPHDASGSQVGIPKGGEIQQLQWQLLKQYLMVAGLMPVPEVLLQVCDVLVLLGPDSSYVFQCARACSGDYVDDFGEPPYLVC
jgi:hypothetical protein